MCVCPVLLDINSIKSFFISTHLTVYCHKVVMMTYAAFLSWKWKTKIMYHYYLLVFFNILSISFGCMLWSNIIAFHRLFEIVLEKLMSYNYHHIISNYYYDYFFSLRNKLHPQTLQIKVMQDPGKRNNIPFSIKEVKVRKSGCSTKSMNSETKFFFPMRQ